MMSVPLQSSTVTRGNHKIRTNRDVLADICFTVEWDDGGIHFADCYYAEKVNFWRDLFPEGLYDKLLDKSEGDGVEVRYGSGEFAPAFDPFKAFTLNRSQFGHYLASYSVIEPRFGRFYPKGILKGVTGVFRQNMIPFRCVGIYGQDVRVDFNHSLSQKSLKLRAILDNVWAKNKERGGKCNDWPTGILSGPGMQARYNQKPTDFFSDDPFVRADTRNDSLFYRMPRLIAHLDDRALQEITSLYGKIVPEGSHVLDLMGSWKSHIPETLNLKSLVGLGLNKGELENNSQLTDFVIHDLNANPTLPFGNDTFDAVICTVSVEYMTRPFEVFEDAARILKPDGYFILTFSNRWFPPKVIKIWQDIHELERIGLVLEYFLKTEKFKDLNTYSIQGLPRPDTDNYFPKLLKADPVLAAWGQRI
jgi:hypothetical protein